MYITLSRGKGDICFELHILIISGFISVCITGVRRNSDLIKYSDSIMIYHYTTGGRRNLNLIKYSGNIMIYYYITGGRRNSHLMKYSDNI